jgi:hypothetical protein
VANFCNKIRKISQILEYWGKEKKKKKAPIFFQIIVENKTLVQMW